ACGNTQLNIDKCFLVKTLHKPSQYNRHIEANPENYMVSIPPYELEKLPRDLQYYIKWGATSGTAKPAVVAYGRHWYSHVNRQMETKRPFWHIVIPDKFDILFAKRGVFATYSPIKVAASKNFFMVRLDEQRTVKLLTGWLNSTIFISALLIFGRKISNNWTRFLKDDYLQLPILDCNAIKETRQLAIVQCIEEMLNKPLPPLWRQLDEKYRFKLDMAVARAIRIEKPEDLLYRLYSVLKKKFL
ncbi:MAG: N-6 DNA methylase, partial [Candidatus Ranarchaeia archaeon]